MATIRTLSDAELPDAIPALADVLIDCVHGGASVSFQAPLAREKAEAFWHKVSDAVRAGATRLLVAEVDGRIVGTVQVQFATSENQPHRGDIAKMLVHSAARRLGIAAALMRAAEAEAKQAGRTLLVLDTHTGSAADRLYTRLGWVRVGEIPGYALMPYGGPCDTTYFYKQI
jgi:GNAT superfamily N-acetyltransferase